MSERPIQTKHFEKIEENEKAFILDIDGKKKFLWKETFSKDITLEEYKELILNEDKFSEIHDLTSRAGKPYRARFFWDWDKSTGDRDPGFGNLSLDFPSEEKADKNEE